ncbi:MAG: hypothetical protein ACLQU4_10685 [Limisphaerales bacterium]
MENEQQAPSSASELLSRVRALISQTGPDMVGDEGFNRLSLALFAFQFEGVPIYRRLCESRGVRPGSIKHWSRIPALPGAAFKEHVVSSLPESDRSCVFHSSGTTGHVPSRHYHGAASLSLYEASLLPWFERHFPAAGGAAFLFLTPPPELAPHSSLVHMFETIRSKLAGSDGLFAGQLEADGSWSLDFNRLGSAVRAAISSNRPVALLGTAFSFVHWLDHLAVNKTPLRLPAGSRLMETGGYKGRSRAVARADLRRLMTKYLAVPESHIVAEYGMSELSSQAYDGVAGEARPLAGLFRFPPWVRTQIISPETGAVAAAGETGLLRVFDPANMYSVMALQTEDLAVGREDGFELRGRAESAGPRGCSLMAAT